MPKARKPFPLSDRETGLVQSIIRELQDWPVQVLSGHKSAGHPLHKLVFLAELGYTLSDPGIEQIVDKILEHQSAQGPFQVLVNVSPSYGGTGEDQWAWALCDAPLLLYALVKFGMQDDPRIQKGIEHLLALERPNGWPCAVSEEQGKWRGPGRKDDPCPYANLIMLQLMSVLPDQMDSKQARTGAESALSQWEKRLTEHPYMFYMGTDFCKLKAPLVWYDIVHVLDILSRFPYLVHDKRLLDMWRLVKAKRTKEGQYIPESVYQAWKDWDFGQKKQPSAFLTRIIDRIEKQLQND